MRAPFLSPSLYVSVSSHYDRPKRIKEALKNGKLLYRFDGGAQTEHRPADTSVAASRNEEQGLSDSEDSEKSPITSELGKKVVAAEQTTETPGGRIEDYGEQIAGARKDILRDIRPIGHGAFGDIYDQFKGRAQEAIAFLSEKQGGEAIGALHHKDVGDIDLVWGNEGTGHSDGFGLAKLVKYHPEVLNDLQGLIDDMHVISRNANRVNLGSNTHKTAVRLEWDGEKKKWLLTAFEKENSVRGNTTDTDTTVTGKQNDTATLQNTVSDNKDSDIPSKKQNPGGNSLSPDDAGNGRTAGTGGREKRGREGVELYRGIIKGNSGLNAGSYDSQGNPVDSNGKLLIDKLEDISEPDK